MIFYLTDSLRGDSAYLNSIKHELHNLAYSAIEGSHYLTGDYDILGDCIKLFEGDDEVSGFFKHLYENWYSMPVPNCVTHYMEVVKSNPSSREENGRIIAQRPISAFRKMTSLSPCQLVCENDSDCEFYKFVGEWYVKRNKINANIEFNTDGSGGCGLAKEKVWKHLMQDQICLCILDSDKWYEGKDDNPNSKDCRDAYKGRTDCKCLILDVRELENLIPLNYADDFTTTHPDYQHDLSKDYIRYFSYLRNSAQRDNILPYFDFKEGIKKDDNYIADPSYRDFAKLCWMQNPEINNGLTFAEYEQRVGKNKLIYYPFSRKVASYTMGYITERRVNGTLKDPELLPFQEAEWNRIGKEIATWGYSRPTEAVS